MSTDDEMNRAIAEILPVYGLRNYCSDLNAMHEAEKFLPQGGYAYEKCLHNLANGRGERATARQRAEAFLKTVAPK